MTTGIAPRDHGNSSPRSARRRMGRSERRQRESARYDRLGVAPTAAKHRGNLLPATAGIFSRLLSGGARTVRGVPRAQVAGRRQAISESLIERSLGRFGGWQMTTGAKHSHEVELRTASGQLISRARGARLGAVEADMLTWLLAQWVRSGCRADGGVRTTIYQLASALYGPKRNGSADRRQAIDALLNLHMASITLTDYDAAGGDIPGRWVDVHLVRRIHYGEELMALREDRQPIAPETLGALRGETLVVYIDDWLIGRLQREQLRAWLDWPIQRRLGAGIGKRLWLYLEPHPGFRALKGAAEGMVLRLTDEVYAELGANCRQRRDNRKSIRRGIDRIQEVDERYLLLEFSSGEDDKPDRLRVIRRLRESTAGRADSARPGFTRSEAAG
jgi:hypothetical protein